ncbi:MAG: sigma-54-dependent Fis family transcriptional regulator [Treponema sp.]|uniref:sigma 54-interacting transcriptional regulator n=1 Tax=Treponema sp. TaxID=166 RepID=UPI00298D7C76|nr:sigma 54-interacting transcriptional regulator [Treponema sp.]MBR5932658.1 sigma-54-dependent Fis family transcriptional regulator [Treponema sp.]
MEKVFYSLGPENPELSTFCRYVTGGKAKVIFIDSETKLSESEKQKLIKKSRFIDFSHSLFREKNSKCFYGENEIHSIRIADEIIEPESDTHLPRNVQKKAENSDERLDTFIKNDPSFSIMIGNCESIKQVKRKIFSVKDRRCKVLFIGESGTGKTTAAEVLHKAGPDRNTDMIHLNVGSLQKDLVESTLFGSVKGAFTDAVDRTGLIPLAKNGMIFLDEIGEMPLDCQAKLLRVLDEGKFRRVGSDREEKTDARFVFATNKDLKELVKHKLFREDLYWRIAEFVIEIPPLRKRKEDLMMFADFFLKDINQREMLNKVLSESAKEKILEYDWPGNLRELKACLKIAAILSPEDVIKPQDIEFIWKQDPEP